MATTLRLKWGTIKGWSGFEEGTKAYKLAEQYIELGSCISAMLQRDTPEQKQIICDLINEVDEIWNDWAGGTMTKEEAKKYILEYGKEKANG